MGKRKLKAQVIGLEELLAFILFIGVIMVTFDLIAPYIGLKGPGISERIIYKLRELFMMEIPDMVAMYHFEGGPAVGKVVEDSSGHKNDGTLVGDVTLSITEAFIGNGSIYFNDAASYFKVYKEDEDPKKRLPRYFDSIKGELTIDFWIKLEEVVHTPTIIETDNFYAWITDKGTLVITFILEGDEEKYLDSGAITLKQNSWTHVAITYTNTTGKGEMFVNGRVANSAQVSPEKKPLKPHTGGALTVGKFKGYMDELRIYNRALNPAEITLHFQGLY